MTKEKNQYIDAEYLFTEANRLEERGRYREAFQNLLTAAQSGHCMSQLGLGVFYSDGLGVRKNLEKAAYWYKKAYRNGEPVAASACAARNLAIELRAAGKIRSSIFWFNRAIAMKDGTAYVALAEIYAAQRGGKKKAVTLLKRVLRLNDEFASEIDKDEAHALLQKISGTKVPA